jgi:hypothetical protein
MEQILVDLEFRLAGQAWNDVSVSIEVHDEVEIRQGYDIIAVRTDGEVRVVYIYNALENRSLYIFDVLLFLSDMKFVAHDSRLWLMY